ncbi:MULTISPECIES: enoyl-CoA hydratase-related protein [unclassified Achromobacter]|uniref:enoyl-CoA hydratase-related protein n=1 Tax=unclassified Achromobacter TaxID=2626865 RepID=UPI000B51879F|nr:MULTISPECIES: enoyl-CoA hydratase-related protein [unclassified Achromobacter]OWT76799.1 enoyl-CoA hydratase [Achromobacter sp. HZ28]OWT77679.1 enoyl-CoA hydratase [Achromobacter sp. HZ34]
MPQTLEIEYKPQAAWVWLSRPDVRNAIDPLMVRELTETFQALGRDPQVRAIVLAGRGIGFCAGADIGQARYGTQPGEADETDERADALACAEMLHTIYACPKATIARVHGICMSVGMGLAAACDITIASSQATFALPETRLGLVPAVISPYVLRAIGPRQATRWFLTGETFSAAEAWRIGFVHDLCEPESLDLRISALVDTFMLTAPDAVSATKQMVHDLPLRSLDADTAEDQHDGGNSDGRSGGRSDGRNEGPADGIGKGGALNTAPATAGAAVDAIGAVASSAAVLGARLPDWVVAGDAPTGLTPV